MNTKSFYGSRRTEANQKAFRIRIPPEESDDSELDSSDDDYIPTAEDANYSESSESDSESELPHTNGSWSSPQPSQPCTSQGTRKITWQNVPASQSEKPVPIWMAQKPHAVGICEPIDYFRYFFDSTLLELITEQSNLFAAQCNITKPLKLSSSELEQFLGTVMYTSIMKLPCSRMYWSQRYRISQVADIMARDRWEEIKRNLHFHDNSAPLGSEKDNLKKFRPLINDLLPKFQNIPMSQHLSVDEQIAPHKGHFNPVMQYIPSKPKSWGFKIFLLCDSRGVVYNFHIYSGKIEALQNGPDIGACGNIVLRLTEIVPRNQNFLVHFDNWFTSPRLQVELSKRGIHSLGTVRTNRLGGCQFSSDAVMKKKERGTFEEKQALVDGIELRAIKWYDRKLVALLTTYASAHPVGVAKRWDRRTKQKIDVPCPSAVLTYNQFMGGVDLIDELVSFYRITIRSKKWYLRLFFHFLDLVVAVSWLLYRRDFEQSGAHKREQKSLVQFKSDIADCLCRQNKDLEMTKRRGRPSSSPSVQNAYDTKKKRGPTSTIPAAPVRTDGYGHWPSYLERKGRCKLPGCSATTQVFCMKCKNHLCFTPKKNCFFAFHNN